MHYLFKGFIYITTNKINGKHYIGKKTFDKKGLWVNYLGSGTNIKRSIKKYGVDNFERKIIAYAFTSKDLNELEKYYIDKFNAVESDKFYNIASGGDGGNTLKGLSKEALDNRNKKISEGNKGKKIPREVVEKILATKIKNGTLKPNISEEKRKQIAEKLRIRNKNRPREIVEKMIATRRANGNMKLSEEAKRKISIANKGKNNGMYGRKGELHHNYGKKLSDETRKKISDNHARVDGEYAPNKRGIVQLDKEGNYINQFVTAKFAADSVGGSNSKVIAVCRGKRKTHKNYKWMYIEDYYNGKESKKHQDNIDILENEKEKLK